jgi:hypothetical protein
MQIRSFSERGDLYLLYTLNHVVSEKGKERPEKDMDRRNNAGHSTQSYTQRCLPFPSRDVLRVEKAMNGTNQLLRKGL